MTHVGSTTKGGGRIFYCYSKQVLSFKKVLFSQLNSIESYFILDLHIGQRTAIHPGMLPIDFLLKSMS